jgi:hypothetical protein
VAAHAPWSVRKAVIVGAVAGLIVTAGLFSAAGEVGFGEPLLVSTSRSANGGPAEFEVQTFGRRVYLRRSDPADGFVLEQIVFVGLLPFVGATAGGFVGYRLARRGGVAPGPTGA